MTMRWYRRSYGGLVLIALLLRASSIYAIQNVHLALGGDASQMTVSWLTFDETDSSIVEYGTESGVYNNNATGESITYASISAGYNHHVVLSGLSPSTRYYFHCGGPESWSYEHSFETRPSDISKPFSIGVYGDMGVDESADNLKQLLGRVQNNAFDFIWHLGDMSYANDHLFYEDTWNEWFTMVEPISSAIPYMVAPGNHEVACRVYEPCYMWTQNFTVYKYKFRMPYQESGSSSPMYYSFNYGLAHFISISTETGYPGSPYGDDEGQQLAWLENDLIQASKNRDAVPWIFVGGHRPIYSAAKKDHTGEDPAGAAAHLQSAIEPLLNKYMVNVFFTGHVHLYERQYPVYQNITVGTTYTPPGATVHIVSGAGGNVEGLDHFSKNVPDWHAFGYNQDQGYGVLNVVNSSTITWEFFDTTGMIQDNLTITNWYLDS